MKKRRAQIDLLVMLVCVAIVAIVSHAVDLYDIVDDYLESHESYEIDEIVISLAALGLLSLVYSFRRLSDVRGEVIMRKQAQTELASLNETLEEKVEGRTRELNNMIAELQRAIQERQQVHDHLSRTEKLYLEMFMHMNQGIGIVDEHEVIQYCNPAYARIFEVDSVDELIGRNLSEFLTPELYQQAKAGTRDRKRGKQASYEMEIITAKQHRKPILVSAVPKYDAQNTFVGTYGTVTDLTELKKLQDLSMRVERLDEAGRVAGQIAHDFNNLLSPLIAYPELIKRKLPEDHPVLHYLDTIEYSARQIAEINQDLLTLGRRGQYKTGLLNLSSIVERAVEQFKHKHRDIAFKVSFSPDLQAIIGGQSQLARSLVNLIANAIDAMPKGGTITLRTENISHPGGQGAFGEIPEGEYVRLVVGDTGGGIPPEVLPRIMDPFFSTKNADEKSGSGLGLSVVYSVMKDHNGYIDVISTPGEGTEFLLYFPPSTNDQAQETMKTIQRGTERILVVDDEAMQRDVISALLQSLGYRVEAVESGEAAIKLSRSHSFDLVILDSIMADGLTGYETFSRIRAIWPKQRAILISGTMDFTEIAEEKVYGIRKFLRKPLDLISLSAAVRAALDEGKERKPREQLVTA